MTKTIETAVTIGTRIGRAIARDVIADNMPREWTGLDPQDVDQIPEGMDAGAVEAVARRVYLEAIDEDSVASGDLTDYDTGEAIRPATAEERAASIRAAEHDGGAGVIDVDGRRCYVAD